MRTVIAFPNEKLRHSIMETLERGGITVHAVCRTGGEAIRAIQKMGGGVLLCSPRLPDMTADELSENLRGLAFCLVAGRPNDLEICENEDLFRLRLPASGGEICGSTRILIELDGRRNRGVKPERGKDKKELVREAKELLMKRDGMTEEQAHRFLQRRSMETSTPMAEVAEMFLKALG